MIPPLTPRPDDLPEWYTEQMREAVMRERDRLAAEATLAVIVENPSAEVHFVAPTGDAILREYAKILRHIAPRSAAASIGSVVPPRGTHARAWLELHAAVRRLGRVLRASIRQLFDRRP